MNMRVTPLRPGSAQPSEIDQLRAQIGVQAVVIEAMVRSSAALAARLEDMGNLLRGLAPPSPDLMAQEVAARPAPAPLRLTLVQIADMVVQETGVSVADLRGPRRTKLFAMARALFCAAARRAKYSLEQIGLWINRDHTSVLASSRHEASARAYFADMRASLSEGVAQ